MVGRFADLNGADDWKNNLLMPDIADAQSHSQEYLPVIWPGFSWHNLNAGPTNQIPRQGGHFFWRQAYNAVSAGVNMIYIAMFDEVDEGTAIYKLAPTAADIPDQGYWLTLDADGYSLPSDWYLRLADETGRMLRHETSVTSTMPVDPGPHYTKRGTPLTWLESNGLTMNGYENADVSDADQDGMPAWAEYVAGTVPTNGTSVFNITGLFVHPASASAIISWPAICCWRFLFSADLSGAPALPGWSRKLCFRRWLLFRCCSPRSARSFL